jgi:hypothetical protein
VSVANVASGGTESSARDGASAPLAFTVVRGEPTAEELAGLIAVLAARAAAAADSGPGSAWSPGAGPEQGRSDGRNGTRSGWTDRSRYVRRQLTHSAGGWRASAFPR